MTIKCSLILPCYNEAEHIRASLSSIFEYLKFVFGENDFEIILIDDFSTDGTREFLRSLRPSNTLRVEFNEKNLGRGATVKRGMKLAQGRSIGFMDIDCEVSEVYLPKFVQMIEMGSDIVVAHRTFKIAANFSSFVRHTLSIGYRKLVTNMIGLPVTDSEAGYKFFSPRARDLIVNLSQFDDWFWDTECLKVGEFHNLHFAEVPVLFRRNCGKTSTVRPLSDSLKYLVAIGRFKQLAKRGIYGNLDRKTEFGKEADQALL